MDHQLLLKNVRTNTPVFLVGDSTSRKVADSFKVIGRAKAQPENFVLSKADGKLIVRHESEPVVLCTSLLF